MRMLSSDVDIAVEPEHLDAFKQCLDAAAAASDCALIHQARYTNYSFVYRHPEGEFVRVDVETEVRWRIFPVLSASSIIRSRRKCGAFYIPHPRHESVILFVASVWRECVKERYRERLAALTAEFKDAEEVARTFRSCFGHAGPILQSAQQAIPLVALPQTVWPRVKRSIIFAVAMRPTQTEAHFTLKSLDTTEIEVLNENRKIPVEKSQFTDNFKPYEVHLYKLK